MTQRLRLKFSSWLLNARAEQHLTQENAAEMLNITTRHYQQLEGGKSLPGFILAVMLVYYFKLDLLIFTEAIQQNDLL